MANEFGNVGALSRSNQRLNQKHLETSSSIEAQWEAFYGGYWRDISSDFSYDVTKDGNTIARCIRWDDGFRSYREDRGLIIREKTKQEEGGAPSTSEDIVTFGTTFAKSFATSAAISVAASSFKNLIEPQLAKTTLGKVLTKAPLTGVGSFLSQNKVGLAFTAINLLKDTGQSTSEKLGQAALSLGISLVLKRLGPAAIFIGPAIGMAEGLIAGKPFGEIVLITAGSILGQRTGKAINGKIFGTTGAVTMNQSQKDILTKEQLAETNKKFRDELLPKFGTRSYTRTQPTSLTLINRTRKYLDKAQESQASRLTKAASKYAKKAVRIRTKKKGEVF